MGAPGGAGHAPDAEEVARKNTRAALVLLVSAAMLWALTSAAFLLYSLDAASPWLAATMRQLGSCRRRVR